MNDVLKRLNDRAAEIQALVSMLAGGAQPEQRGKFVDKEMTLIKEFNGDVENLESYFEDHLNFKKLR